MKNVGLEEAQAGIKIAKAFDCVYHNKLWKIPRDGNTIPPYLSPKEWEYQTTLPVS